MSEKNWAKNSVGKKSLGTNKVKSDKPKKGKSGCEHLIVFFGQQEPGPPVKKVCYEVPTPNFWAELQLPYCPKCGEKL